MAWKRGGRLKVKDIAEGREEGAFISSKAHLCVQLPGGGTGRGIESAC